MNEELCWQYYPDNITCLFEQCCPIRHRKKRRLTGGSNVSGDQLGGYHPHDRDRVGRHLRDAVRLVAIRMSGGPRPGDPVRIPPLRNPANQTLTILCYK